MGALVISNVLLWAVIVALVIVVLALSRQIGVLYERVAPMGALTMDKGPEVGDAAPTFELNDLLGRPQTIGMPSTHSQLLFFLSPTCPVCKKLMPILRSIASTEKSWLRVVLASDGEMPEHLAFYKQANLDPFPYILSTSLGMSFHISKLPYAVLMDENGVIRAKGLINSREQLESLFTAKELGVASMQDYLRHAETNPAELNELNLSRKEKNNALVG
ncbi:MULTISPECIES: methylamine dehydrogenase accessory protein MauD [Paenalcaligenes]|uniref:Methylamine utilization protein MauD n=1 Tax=Paenalcaligenes hermetiae TaxID=1157987 RepID=A0ABP9LWC0_9BURK|nr:methylamine dehydrogenase accessory protein MauD [Paenalcaligenes sp.]